MVLVDLLPPLLHPTSTLLGLHDSGAYQDIPPRVDYTPFGEQCRLAYQLYQPTLSPRCAAAYPAEPWRCVCGEFALPLLETPSQVILHQYDSYQLSQNLGREPAAWSHQDCLFSESPFRTGMAATAAAVAAETAVEHVVFAPACYRHGLLTSR